MRGTKALTTGLQRERGLEGQSGAYGGLIARARQLPSRLSFGGSQKKAPLDGRSLRSYVVEP